jgi:hypothetical protein
MKTFDIVGMVAELEAIDRDLERLGLRIIERACQIVQKKAKAAIGREHEEWPDLAPSTIADKEHHGYPVPKPLLRSGSFRDSIQFVTSGNEGAVGTDDPRGVWFEYGTSCMPPRPVLVPAAIASEDRIRRLVGTSVVAVLSGHGRHASELGELLRLLREAGHEIKEQIEDLFDDDETEHSR